MTTDLKKLVIELNIVGTLRDKINKSSGLQFELKVGEELIAKWFEMDTVYEKLHKKIRFPFKFKYLNSTVSQLRSYAKTTK